MSEFTKLPPKLKSSTLVHLSGLLLCLSLLFYTVFIFVSWNCQRLVTEVVSVDPYEGHFNKYLKNFGKKYEAKEYSQRLQNFKRSCKEIERLNSHYNEGIFGWTKFSDMTPEEYEKKLLLPPGSLGECNDVNQTCNHEEIPTVAALNEDIPLKFDWRDHNVVGPVLDQGMCLSCWAFSVVGVMESMLLITNQTDFYQRLSIQELTDCSNYTDKCDGGSPVKVLKFLCYERIAITSEEHYPLTNKNEDCKIWTDSGITITNMVVKCDVEAREIARLVSTHGPVVAVVDNYPWQNYLGGVIQYHCSDSWDHIKHVVQIVGYDMTAEVPYFILRNSWGVDFGVKGYVMVAMEGFVCGIGRQISYFDVTKVKY